MQGGYIMKTTLLYLFIYIIEALILWSYSSNLFHSRYSKKIEFIGLFTGYGFLFLLAFIKVVWINLLFFLLINFIFFIIFYKLKWNLCLLHSMVLACLMSLSELTITGLFSHFNSVVLYNSSDFLLLVILTIFSKIFYYIGIRIIITLMHGIISENGHINRATILLNIIPLISLYIILIMTAGILSTKVPSGFKPLLSSCAILLFVINILVMYIYYYTQQKSHELINLQIQLQKEYDMAEYYKTLFKQDESQKILIHDIRKHFMSIANLNEQNEQDKIRQYLDTILNSSDLQTSVHISDNELLNYIICHYIQLCKNKNINLKVDVRKKMLQHLDYSELTALFCNLLDNAIEACINIHDSYIDLSITSNEINHITIINIVNTCNTIPTFNKSGMPISNKNNKLKHGFGLKSVERIINKYNGNIKMYFNNKKMTFHTVITMEDC